MAFAKPKENIQRLGLGEGMSVADFGAGAGYHTLEAARRVGDGGIMYAVEIQRELVRSIQRAADREGLDQVKVIWGDIEEANGSHLADESVQAVLLINTLFQLEDKAAALREAFRVLRPRGRMLLIDWQDSFGGLGPKPEDITPLESASDLGEAAGFDRIESFDAGGHHYGIIFRKS